MDQEPDELNYDQALADLEEELVDARRALAIMYKHGSEAIDTASQIQTLNGLIAAVSEAAKDERNRSGDIGFFATV